MHARPVQVAGRDMPVLITTATAYHSFNGDNGGNGNNGNNGPDLGYGPAHAAHAAPAASAPPAYREVIGRDALTGSGGGAVEGDLAFARQLRESEDARIARYAHSRPETPIRDPSSDPNISITPHYPSLPSPHRQGAARDVPRYGVGMLRDVVAHPLHLSSSAPPDPTSLLPPPLHAPCAPSPLHPPGTERGERAGSLHGS